VAYAERQQVLHYFSFNTKKPELRLLQPISGCTSCLFFLNHFVASTDQPAGGPFFYVMSKQQLPNYMTVDTTYGSMSTSGVRIPERGVICFLLFFREEKEGLAQRSLAIMMTNLACLCAPFCVDTISPVKKQNISRD